MKTSTLNTSPKEKMHLSPEEEALITISRGDLSAFAGLYRAYVRPVYRYLYSRLGRVEDAEDLTTQVFLEALEGLPGYRHKGYFSSWLFTIAHNKFVDHCRRNRVEFPLENVHREALHMKDPLVRVIQSEEIQRLAEQIQKLEEDEQEICDCVLSPA